MTVRGHLVRATSFVALGVLVLTLLACSSSDSSPTPDIPEFSKGEATKRLKAALGQDVRVFCGLISSVPLVLWEYEKAKYQETYLGARVWLVSTDIPGGGTAKPFRNAKWHVNESTKAVTTIAAPEDC